MADGGVVQLVHFYRSHRREIKKSTALKTDTSHQERDLGLTRPLGVGDGVGDIHL